MEKPRPCPGALLSSAAFPGISSSPVLGPRTRPSLAMHSAAGQSSSSRSASYFRSTSTPFPSVPAEGPHCPLLALLERASLCFVKTDHRVALIFSGDEQQDFRVPPALQLGMLRVFWVLTTSAFAGLTPSIPLLLDCSFHVQVSTSCKYKLGCLTVGLERG